MADERGWKGTWCGWYRPHRLAKWRQLCAGPSERGVCIVLHNLAAIGRFDLEPVPEMMVLPEGKTPEEQQAVPMPGLPPVTRHRHARD
jgi:hypothetical protein